MKFNFRKIASVASSTLMVASSVALAAAANFPAPFVSGGSADVAVVYGSAAATPDLLAVTDITTSLQASLSGSGSGGSGGPNISGGDSVVLSKPSDKVNLGNSITGVFGTILTDDDLEILLADGVYTNDENTDYDYEQRITLGSGLQFEFFSDSDFNDRAPSLGINLTTTQLILNYSLDFTGSPESDLTSGDLVDFETTTIDLFGREYYISDFDNSTRDMTLLDTANSGIVESGQSTTVNVGGKSYEVRIVFISTQEVKLDINGEVTNTLSEGGTFKLTDGSYVGIKDILATTKEGTVDKVEFSIGSGKLELRNGQSIKLNDETIQEVVTENKGGSTSGGKGTLDRINLVWTTQEDEFIASGSELVFPGFENLKFSAEIVLPSEEVTYVRDGASDYLQIETTIKDGPVTIPFLYANASGEFVGIGKSGSEMLTTNNSAFLFFNYTRGDRYFIGSWNSSSDQESYYLRLANFINDNGINKTTIQKYSNNAWVDACEDRRPGDTCTLGSLTLTVSTLSNYPDRAAHINGSSGAHFAHLYTAEGLKVFLPFNTTVNDANLGVIPGSINLTGAGPTGHDRDTFNLVFVEEDKDDNVAAGSRFNVTVNDNSDGEVEASAITTGRTTITNPDDSNHIMSHVYSDLGTRVERKGLSSDQREATITYYGEQIYANAILSDISAVIGGSGSSGGVSDLGSVAVSDAEASQVYSKNLIVVGGSCVNTVAAALLGSDSPLCGSAFEAATSVGSGSFLIQSFSSPFASSKVATLVAGYNAADTTNAAKYLTTQTVMTDAGKKYVGTSSTQASLIEESS